MNDEKGASMRRIMIIGSGGAGKSTLAVRIGERLGLPVVHLDSHYWNAGWVPTPDDVWGDRVQELVGRDEWVMDGNYGGTLELRLAACDTVIFLDMSRALCLARVVKRWVRYRGRTRPDMTDGCPEQIDREFLKWIWTYPVRSRPRIMRKLEALSPEKRVVIIRSRGELERFVDELMAVYLSASE
jgi:adenylate kinase family enzyme